MRFDLSPVKAALDAQYGAGRWTAQSITLQLTAAPDNDALFNRPAAGRFLISWMQNDTWIEGTGKPHNPATDGITSATLPAYLGAADQGLGTFSFDGATSGVKTFSLTLSSGIMADLTAGGFASLRFAAADATVSALFRSRDYTQDPNANPVLTIVAVPEPAATGLAVAGGLLMARRRRKK